MSNSARPEDTERDDEKCTRLEDCFFILRRYDNTRNYGESLSLPELKARLRQCVSREIVVANFRERGGVRTTASA